VPRADVASSYSLTASAAPGPAPAAQNPLPTTTEGDDDQLPDPEGQLGRLHDPPEYWYQDCDLPKRAARLLWWGLSTNTRRTYRTARNNYVRFCHATGISPGRQFPATSSNLCLWVDYMAAQCPPLQAKTIGVYLVGLRSLHIDLGFSVEQFEKNPVWIAWCGV
jgi:hypothetical protein